MYLLLKTDDKLAVVLLHDGDSEIERIEWQAHRELSDTVLIKLRELLDSSKLTYKDLAGVGVFAGPGSFTGLRIGHTLVNTLSYSLDIPVASAPGEDWVAICLEKLKAYPDRREIVVPEYGRGARITKQKK